jgi:anti-sigma factor RsiW
MANTCKECIDLLLDYVEGELPLDVRSRLESHMGGCEPCEQFLKTYQATPGLCRKALAAKMPDDFARKLTDFLRVEMQKDKKA